MEQRPIPKKVTGYWDPLAYPSARPSGAWTTQPPQQWSNISTPLDRIGTPAYFGISPAKPALKGGVKLPPGERIVSAGYVTGRPGTGSGSQFYSAGSGSGGVSFELGPGGVIQKFNLTAGTTQQARENAELMQRARKGERVKVAGGFIFTGPDGKLYWQAEQEAPQQQPLQQLAQSYQTALQQANEANEARYAAIMQGYRDMYGQAVGLLDQLGHQQREDIGTRYGSLATQNYQDLVSRGLSGTTVPATMRVGLEREKSAELRRLDEQLANLRLAYDTQIRGNMLNFMERRTDEGPDFNQLANIAMAYGLGGGQIDPAIIQMLATAYTTPQPATRDWSTGLPVTVGGVPSTTQMRPLGRYAT